MLGMRIIEVGLDGECVKGFCHIDLINMRVHKGLQLEQYLYLLV